MSKKSKPNWWRWRYFPEHPNDPFGMRKKKLKTLFLGTVIVGAVAMSLYDRLESLGVGYQKLTSFVRETVRENGVRRTRDIIIATVITLTSGTSFSKPSDWNNLNNTIECYGGGGAGGYGLFCCGVENSGGGGGGGGYSITSNLSIAASVSYAIGAGGVANNGAGGTTSFTGASSAGGGGGGASNSGAGGAGGPGTHTGGAGSNGSTFASGGGGCAGPNGNGGAGSNSGGGGGGGGQAGAGAAGGTSTGAAGNLYGGGGAGGSGAAGGTANGGNGAQGIIVVTYTPAAPTVTGVSPAGGTTVGGAVVTVSGTNFLVVNSVTFGGTAGTSVSVTNSTTLTVHSPAHAAGQVDVQVNTTGGTSPINAFDKFVYGVVAFTRRRQYLRR